MSSNLNISGSNDPAAPTPQNTPLNAAPIALGLSRPTVPDIQESDEDGDDAEALAGELAKMDLAHHLLPMVQGRLAGLLGRSSGYVEALPNDVKLNVEGLVGIQTKQNELQSQYKLECLELEKKYLGLAQPLYERRKAIISGAAPATADEIAAGEKANLEEDDEYEVIPKDAPPSTTGIPEFWLTALRNHVAIAELITERDEAALKHLTDVSLQYLDAKDTPGFKIVFNFSPNEFFENATLEKTYIYQTEVSFTGDFVYDRAIGSEIKWKEDKDLTTEFEIKKQRNKTTNRTRLVRKAKPAESFFNFFSPPVAPTPEQLQAGDFEDEELEEIEEKLEMDYQVGEDLKEKVIPHAVDYFTGKALEYDFDEDDEDDYDDDDECGDECGHDHGDDDDDDDSDSDAPGPAARKAKKGGAAKGAAGQQVNPEDCKQQ